MRTIEIDIEVHKAIEAARTSFSQTDNDILRRLLQIDRQLNNLQLDQPPSAEGRSWRGFNRKKQKYTELTHGTRIKASYSGQELHGTINDGAIVVNGRRYGKPSPALHENVTTKAGGHTQLNGWREWRAQVGQRWVALTDL